jgi:hypothetical protein
VADERGDHHEAQHHSNYVSLQSAPDSCRPRDQARELLL